MAVAPAPQKRPPLEQPVAGPSPLQQAPQTGLPPTAPPEASQVADMGNVPPAPGQVPPPEVQAAAQTPAPGLNPAPAPAAGFPEPYGAQVLRRIHEDHSILIQDYDEMFQLLEQDQLKQFLLQAIQGCDQILSGVEQHFAQCYGHLPPIDGAMPVGAGAPPGAAPPIQQPGAPPMEGDVPPGEDVVVVEDDAPPGEEGEEAPPEEEGKGPPDEENGKEKKEKGPPKKKGEKALTKKQIKEITSSETTPVPANSGAKAMTACPKCGKSPCVCGSSVDVRPSIPMDTKDCGMSLCDALNATEKKKVREAHSFLGELRDLSYFNREHQMKSYHFGKAMGEIAGYDDSAPDNGMQTKDLEVGGIEDGEKSLGSDIHPHRVKCMGACKFFGSLAKEKAYGSFHRELAGHLHDDWKNEMAEIFEEAKESAKEELLRDEFNQDDQEEMNEEGATEQSLNEQPGEARSKEDLMDADQDVKSALRKAFSEQQKAIEQLNREMSSLAIA